MKTLLSLCAALTLGAALPAQVTHYWVDATNGKDSNLGTRAMPFKSITKGIQAGMVNTVVHVLPGIYSPAKTNERLGIGGTEILSGYRNFRLLGTEASQCILDFENVKANGEIYFRIHSGAKDIEIANLTMKNGTFRPAVSWQAHAIWFWNVDGLDIHHCVIESCEAGIYAATGPKRVRIHDNIFLSCNIAARLQHSPASGSMDIRFYNNLVANGTGGFADTILWNGLDPTTVIVNNLSINNRGFGFEFGALPAGAIVENNSAWNNLAGNYNVKQGTLSITNISKDPQLVDFAKGDYRLKPTSPNIEAGYAVGQPGMVNDFYGNARVSDYDDDSVATPDIGIHEAPGVTLTVKDFAQGKAALFTLVPRQPNVSLGYLFLGFQPVSVVVSPFGSIGIDLSPATSFFLGILPVPGTNAQLIPTLSALNDVTVYAQAYAIAGNVSWKPSGRLDLTL